MRKDIHVLFSSLRKELENINAAAAGIDRLEKALSVIANYLQQLRGIVYNMDAHDILAVVALHKRDIPPVYAEYIYYASLYNLETSRPLGSSLKEIYTRELDRIETWFNEHQEFLRYYTSGKTDLDEIYFVPSAAKTGYFIDVYLPLTETTLCTSYGFLAAMSIAYQRLQVELVRLLKERSSAGLQGSCLHWTHSKTDLTELIYALHAAGVFNKGKATIKEITQFFEQSLQIGLGNTSVTFQEILRRKESTVFLERLNDAFDLYITRLEERNIR